jgi:hypothetical protein
MNTDQKDWDPNSLNLLRKRLNPNPPYQRMPGVWNVQKQERLIDSILRGFDIPKFYIAPSSDSRFDWEIVDGQQRVRAIWDFLEGIFPLAKNATYSDWGNLAGKHYRDLPFQVQQHIGQFNLDFVVIKDATRDELEEMFRRLQEGVSMNPAEYRNAISGNMRDFIADLGNGHKIFKLIHRVKRDRFGWHDLAAHVVCLELAKGPTDVKAANLRQMYEKNKDFDQNGTTAKRVKRILNYMRDVLVNRPPEMDIKWGFVDLYLLISKLIDEYDITNCDQSFERFYINFEQFRRQSKKKPYAELAKGTLWEQRMLEYIQAFETQGALKHSIEKRHHVYKEWALAHFTEIGTDLSPKDRKRLFTYDEKIVIWRRADGRCQNCNKEVTIEEMHADHIMPHSRGGRTIISNGQSLCATCNRKKNARV